MDFLDDFNINTSIYSYRIIAGFKEYINNNFCRADESLKEIDESIETGLSGIIITLIEIYKTNKDSNILIFIEDVINQLLENCGRKTTGNYSFYTGRAGVVYVIIQFYLISPKKKLLDVSLDLIKPASEDFLSSEYVTDYFYNGRAGTLLIMFILFQLTDEQFLLNYIEKYVKKICSNAIVGLNGIYWKNNEEIFLNISNGFAYGTTGITDVLLQINSVLKNDALTFISNEALKFIAHSPSNVYNGPKNGDNFKEQFYYFKSLCNSGRFKKVENKSIDTTWRNGSTGVLIFRMSHFFDDKKNNDLIEHYLKQVLIKSSGESNSLFKGLSGKGLFIFFLGKKINCKISKKELDEIVKTQLLFCEQDIDFYEGLCSDALSGIYFISKLVNNGNVMDSILHPAILGLSNSGKFKKIDFSVAEARKCILKKNFGRTISLLESVQPSVLNDYLSVKLDIRTNLADHFEAFVQNKKNFDLGSLFYKPLEEIFFLESRKQSLLNRNQKTHAELYFEELKYRQEAISHLNRPDEWLIKQKLSISDEIQILNLKWDWKKNIDLAQQAFNSSKSSKVLLKLNSNLEIDEVDIEQTGLILHLFDSPKTIERALREAKHFCKTEDPEIIKAIANSIGLPDIDSLLGRLDYLLLTVAKQFIFDKILVINQ